MLAALDVIWIHDGTIRPPGPKMVVCVEPDLGFFFRVNTDGKWQTPVLLTAKECTFLRHDSYLECGLPLELDEYVVYESIRDRGKIGRVPLVFVPAIVRAIESERRLAQADKDDMIAALQSATD